MATALLATYVIGAIVFGTLLARTATDTFIENFNLDEGAVDAIDLVGLGLIFLLVMGGWPLFGLFWAVGKGVTHHRRRR